MKSLKHLNKYFIKYRIRLILGLLIAVTSRLFAVAVPKFIGDSVAEIEQYIKGEITDIEIVKSSLLINILIIIGCALLSGFFMFLMRQTVIVVSRFIEYDLKNEIYEQYQKLSLSFYKANRTGDLMNRISEDVGKVRMYAGPALMYSVNTITLFAVVLTYMSSIAPTLTLYTIAPLPVLSLSVYYLSVAINKRTTVVQEYLSKLTTFTQESFSGIAVLKAYQIEGRTNTDFNKLANQSKQKSIDLARVQALFFPLMVCLIGVSNIIVIYIGGKQYLDGQISDFGILVEFIIFVNMLTWPVATVGWVSSIIQQAEASQKRINEFLETVPEIQNDKNAIPVTITGAISFENVTFTYPDTGIQALTNLTFKIIPGQTIGIVGNTGSGKSTLLELIGRLYDPTGGQITIDNIPLQNINLQNLRSQMGYVPQDAFLFSDTIENNICFGKNNATETEMIEVAKIASVHKNIIHFKNGYKTLLGERGVTLSGGQKQRVSIARALLKKPSILLLDDSLSAVDTETEKQIIDNFKTLSEKRTSIIVSHRISSVKNADLILVLGDGKLIQKGDHQSLINQKGYYQDLYNKQSQQKEM
ncbi:ABC transporter ATP-binding protein [Aquimarina agarilytica]|uniref:ABC transporter ATP-binding protein n=1 Tax=Aquimarina agarilytica TaxID=1087449 RepID=UPI0002894312|nr:ABC transporter ATP-binding protein [Aquimarina agarilytica]